MARASSAQAPDGVTSSGLTSSSAISGCAAATREIVATAAAAASRSTAGRPRTPRRSGGAAQRLEQAPRRRLVDRCEGERGVLEHLDERAAEADEHDRAEARVLAGADDQLDAVA